MISLPPSSGLADPNVSPSVSGSGLAAEGPLLNGEDPFFLEVEGCPMWAVFHPSTSAAPGPGTAALIVPALGVEQLTGYRSEVLLARALARLGIPTLRFHPRGQGDSGGDAAEVTLDRLAADARAVRAELERRAGVRPLVAVGVRLGALALARALGGSPAPRALALWEPVHEPAAYFRDLMRSVLFAEVAKGRRSGATVETMRETLARDGLVDVLGYPLHRALVETAGQGLAASLAGWSGPTLLAQIDSRRSLARPHAEFAAALAARGVPVEVREVRSEVSWFFLQNPAWESSELVSATADWIASHA